MFRRLAIAAVAAAAAVAVVALPSPAFAADSVTAPVTVVAPPCATTPGSADADTMVTANGKGTLLIRSGLRLYSITSLTTI